MSANNPGFVRRMWRALRRPSVKWSVLTLLLIRALAAHQLPRARVLWMAAMLAVAYAASDEYHQSFVPSRHPSPLDILIDSIGISTATLLAASTYERRIRDAK